MMVESCREENVEGVSGVERGASAYKNEGAINHQLFCINIKFNGVRFEEEKSDINLFSRQ